jgi:hypothetical protein
MSPRPVFLLLLGPQAAEIAVSIAMVFSRPSMVVVHFVSIPHVVVAIVRVIDPVRTMSVASDA